MTGMPAERLGLKDRGILKEGMAADLAVFSPNDFEEQGTTFDPNQLATGMSHVLVNGKIALFDGKLTRERAGAVLRRNSTILT